MRLGGNLVRGYICQTPRSGCLGASCFFWVSTNPTYGRTLAGEQLREWGERVLFGESHGLCGLSEPRSYYAGIQKQHWGQTWCFQWCSGSRCFLCQLNVAQSGSFRRDMRPFITKRCSAWKRNVMAGLRLVGSGWRCTVPWLKGRFVVVPEALKVGQWVVVVYLF
jgi:hypothetical protein